MYGDMRVKYLLLDMAYPAYVRMQATIVGGLLLASLVFFFHGRESSLWVVSNGWWLCLVGAVLEVAEAMVAVNSAKEEYRRHRTDSERRGRPRGGRSRRRTR
jgi:hypothetical protein